MVYKADVSGHRSSAWVLCAPERAPGSAVGDWTKMQSTHRILIQIEGICSYNDSIG